MAGVIYDVVFKTFILVSQSLILKTLLRVQYILHGISSHFSMCDANIPYIKQMFNVNAVLKYAGKLNLTLISQLLPTYSISKWSKTVFPQQFELYI